MAANIYDWDVVEANNATADTALTWAEGQAPSTVNNSARVMMRRGKELLIDLGGSLSAGGTANALTLTAQSAFASLANGRVVSFKATASNTGAATINVNAIGAKAIVKMTSSGESPLTGGEIQNTGMYTLQYSTALNAGVGGWLLLAPTVSGTPQGQIFGLTLSNNAGDPTNDIDISVGEVASDTAPYYRMVLASAITKHLDANWVVGTNQGGLDTGAIANTTYHVFLIQRSDTGVVDALFSLSGTSPTMPANYDRKRRIGSIVRLAGSIKPFVQEGDEFIYLTPVQDVVGVSIGTTASNFTCTIPLGFKLKAIFNAVLISNTAAVHAVIFPGDQSGVTASGTPAGNINLYVQVAGLAAVGNFIMRSSTSAQVRIVASSAVAVNTYSISTLGWVDTRGRLA